MSASASLMRCCGGRLHAGWNPPPASKSASGSPDVLLCFVRMQAGTCRTSSAG
jgi:hypothetical protein